MEFVSDEQRKAVFASINKGHSKKEKADEESSSKLQSLSRDIAPPLVKTVLVLSSAMVPQVHIIYTAYKIYEIGKKLYDFYEQLKEKGLRERAIYLAWEASEEGLEKLSGPVASSIASALVNTSGSQEVISEISKDTNIDKEVYSSMFEGVLKNQMISGIENLASFTVGGIIK